MQSRSWQIRIEDILDAASKIASYTQGMNFEDFCEDSRTFDAVVRNLEVIGEAARYISPDLEAKYPQIPWHSMRAMRNILIHEYFGVDMAIIWQTATENLPPVVPLLHAILEDEDDA